MPGSIHSFVGSTVADVATTRRNLAAVSTIEELISITPKAFAPEFAVLYRKLNDLAIKTSHVKSSVANLETHQSKGTFPPQFVGALKLPQVQVTKEFEGHSLRQEYTTTANANLQQVRFNMLQHALLMKKSEHEYLTGQLSRESIKIVAVELHNKVDTTMSSAFATGTDNEGKATYSDLWAQECKFMLHYCTELCMKAVAIGMIKHQKELVAKLAKLSVKKDTDTAMKDMPANDVKKQIELAVAAALKKAGHKPNPSAKTGTKVQKSPKPQKRPNKPKKDAKGKGNGNKKAKKN